MGYVLGIDSGGTKFLIRAAAEDGAPLAVYSGQSCSHHGRSKEEAFHLISENIDACLGQFGGRREECVGLVCGTTGLDSEEDGEIITSLYRNLSGLNCPMHIVNDAELAHYTVTGGIGIVLIAGTGSIAFGRSHDGRQARVGGWLFNIMGDEGSGRYIDAWVLHHLSRWMDGCRPDSWLLERVREKTGISTRKELMDYAISMATPPWRFPELGEFVAQAARQGDAYARSIVDYAAQWNAKLICEVAGILEIQRDKEFIVGLWGSTVVKNEVLQKALCDRVRLSYPNAEIRISMCDAAEGAVQWALQRNCELAMQKRMGEGR